MTDKQEPVDCIHAREIMQYTGDGDEVAFCPECGQNRLTGHSRANRPADDGLVERLTRPIIGIENRTPQEAFDIMCDRILTALRAQSDAEVERIVAWLRGQAAIYNEQNPNLSALPEWTLAQKWANALERGEHRKDGV